MTGSSKAIDLFTMLSPTFWDVSPISKPPANAGSEMVQSERSRYNGNLHIYTDASDDCLSSVDRLEIWTLTKTTGSNLSLETLTGRTTLMKRPAGRVNWIEIFKMNRTTQSSDTFDRVGNLNLPKRVALSIISCWGHAAPKAVAWRIPSKGKGSCGSPNRSSPVLHHISNQN